MLRRNKTQEQVNIWNDAINTYARNLEILLTRDIERIFSNEEDYDKYYNAIMERINLTIADAIDDYSEEV